MKQGDRQTPKGTVGVTTKLTVPMSAEQRQRISEVADHLEVSQAELVRRAIDTVLEVYDHVERAHV